MEQIETVRGWAADGDGVGVGLGVGVQSLTLHYSWQAMQGSLPCRMMHRTQSTWALFMSQDSNLLIFNEKKCCVNPRPHLRHLAHYLPSRKASLRSQIKIRAGKQGAIIETIITGARSCFLCLRRSTCWAGRGSAKPQRVHQKPESVGSLRTF